MLEASPAIRDAIASDKLVFNLLVKISRSNDEWLLTDAPQDITVGGDTYSASDGWIKSVALPQLRASLGRDLQQITLLDNDELNWINRFEEFTDLNIELGLVFFHNGAYTDALSVFDGQCVASAVNLTTESRELALTATGPFPQTDGEHEAYTTDANQRTRDPTDTAFIHVGLLRELTWGKR